VARAIRVLPQQMDMAEIARMRESVFFDEPDANRKISRFWILLVLASIIAAAGVIGDSTATVIGAMIVAPLMTPIMGTMLGVVLGDRLNLMRSAGFVIGGALAAVGIAYLLGVFITDPVVAATNSQVAGRVNPSLIDLIAALATGIVGSVALVRRDISDTLPGVAIAISLVPPLSVVGLTLEAGAPREAFGAFFLFATNVAAILATGIVVMARYGAYVLDAPDSTEIAKRINRRNAILVIMAFFLLIGGTLVWSAFQIAADRGRQAEVREVTQQWAGTVGWRVIEVKTTSSDVTVRVAGSPPLPDVKDLANRLTAAGIDPDDVIIDFTPQTVVNVGSPGLPD
jgi:uncharacterized hydrophobic protein (TIGR00271 family)